MKPPKSKKYVSFHQDQNYWNIKMDKGLTVQIALSPSNVETDVYKFYQILIIRTIVI